MNETVYYTAWMRWLKYVKYWKLYVGNQWDYISLLANVLYGWVTGWHSHKSTKRGNVGLNDTAMNVFYSCVHSKFHLILSHNSTVDWIKASYISVEWYQATFTQSSISCFDLALTQFNRATHGRQEFSVYRSYKLKKTVLSWQRNVWGVCASMVKVATRLHLGVETGTAANVAIGQLFQLLFWFVQK